MATMSNLSFWSQVDVYRPTIFGGATSKQDKLVTGGNLGIFHIKSVASY